MGLVKNIRQAVENVADARTQRVQARQSARTERSTTRQENRTARATARQAQRQASTEAKAAGGKWNPESVAARQAGFAQLGAAGAQLAGSALAASMGVPPGAPQAVGQVLGALDVGQVGQVLGDVMGTGGGMSYTDSPTGELELSTPQGGGGSIGDWVKENPLPSIAIAGGLFWLLTRKG